MVLGSIMLVVTRKKTGYIYLDQWTDVMAIDAWGDESATNCKAVLVDDVNVFGTESNRRGYCLEVGRTYYEFSRFIMNLNSTFRIRMQIRRPMQTYTLIKGLLLEISFKFELNPVDLNPNASAQTCPKGAEYPGGSIHAQYDVC